MIVFDESKHTYTNSETGESYISVTTLLGEYKPCFDKDRHSARVAEREGVSQEMVLEMWKQENLKATTRGTKIHKLMEEYISCGKKGEDYDWMFNSYDKVVSKHIYDIDKVQCETRLSNDMFAVAGTADLIYDHKNTFTLGDFKTNKKFNFASRYNEWFKAPVEHLQYCEFNNYSLQLSMYAYMYELLSGKKCKKLIVFYLNGDRWDVIHCNYLKNDIVKILHDFSNKK